MIHKLIILHFKVTPNLMDLYDINPSPGKKQPLNTLNPGIERLLPARNRKRPDTSPEHAVSPKSVARRADCTPHSLRGAGHGSCRALP